MRHQFPPQLFAAGLDLDAKNSDRQFIATIHIQETAVSAPPARRIARHDAWNRLRLSSSRGVERESIIRAQSGHKLSVGRKRIGRLVKENPFRRDRTSFATL